VFVTRGREVLHILLVNLASFSLELLDRFPHINGIPNNYGIRDQIEGVLSVKKRGYEKIRNLL
jgi:hypothetical protein